MVLDVVDPEEGRMAKDVGLWIDHAKALIATVSDEGQKLTDREMVAKVQARFAPA